jgi:hypothetical protein
VGDLFNVVPDWFSFENQGFKGTRPLVTNVAAQITLGADFEVFTPDANSIQWIDPAGIDDILF